MRAQKVQAFEPCQFECSGRNPTVAVAVVVTLAVVASRCGSGAISGGSCGGGGVIIGNYCSLVH